MHDVLREMFQNHGRLSPLTVRVLVGVSIIPLLLAVSALFLYDGWHRVAYVSAFALISLTNLVRALGSVLPEERGAKPARLAVTPLAAMMFVALAVTLLFQYGVL